MSLPTYTLRHLLGGLTGSAMGATLSPLFSTEEDSEEAVTAGATGGGLLGLGMASAPHYMQKWIGKNIDNFSEGAYQIKDLNPESFAEKMAFKANGNMGLSLYRNTMGALRGEPYDRLVDTVHDIYGKDANPEDLWKKYQKGRKTATYEEFRLKLLDEQTQKSYNNLSENLKLLEKERSRYGDLRGASTQKRLAHVDLSKSINDIEEKIKDLDKSAKNRLYRHEIAKNEIQNMTWGDKWSKKRLKESGYNYEGMYKWKDVKGFINSSASEAWEKDADKYVEPIKKKLGITKPWALNEDKAVHVVRNIHKSDRMIPIKLGKKYLRLGELISFRMANGDINTLPELRTFIKNILTQHPHLFKPSARDLTSIVKPHNDRIDEFIRRGKTLKSMNYNDLQALSKSTGLSPKALLKEIGSIDLKKLTVNSEEAKEKWIKNVTNNLSNQIKKSGGFIKKPVGSSGKIKIRGAFELPGLGGVSTLYLEGGINTNAKLKPYWNERSNRLEIATRVVKTDIQDAPFSVQTKTQRNPVIVVDEYLRRRNPQAVTFLDDGTSKLMSGTDVAGGKQMYGKTKGADYPISDDSFTNLKNKKLARGDVREILKSPERTIKEKLSKTSKIIRKVPIKATAAFALSKAPSVLLKGAGGLLAYSLAAQAANAMTEE